MKTLNLVNKEASGIKYQVLSYPDGQQNIKILDKNPNKTGYQTENYIAGTNKRYLILDHIVPVQIKSRLNNWLDLELITCAVASLRELGVEEIHLYVPYIIGARSDRKFEEGGNNYIKDVLAPHINLLNFKTVTCIDPHSDVLEACIKGFRKESNEKLVRFFYENLEMQQRNGCSIKSAESICNNTILVSPDAGATKKIYKLAEQISYKGDIITCSKDRDENGNLTKTIVPVTFEQLKSEKDFIIIDDICDGGATFINIAKIIKERNEKYPNEKHPIGKIYLIVTHSIFSKGTDELLKYFDGIFTTNSYKEHDIEKIKVLNIF